MKTTPVPTGLNLTLVGSPRLRANILKVLADGRIVSVAYSRSDATDVEAFMAHWGAIERREWWPLDGPGREETDNTMGNYCFASQASAARCASALRRRLSQAS